MRARACCSTLSPSLMAPPVPIQARYCMISFAVSVLPAPLSPLTCGSIGDASR